jgi:hypothetical protein
LEKVSYISSDKQGLNIKGNAIMVDQLLSSLKKTIGTVWKDFLGHLPNLMGGLTILFFVIQGYLHFFAGILLLWRFPIENGDFIHCGDIEGKA